MSTRREFITLLGGAAAAWPLAVRAQQPTMPVVGFLSIASPTPFAHLVAGLRRGLQDAGFVEGRDVAVEYRWAEGHYDRLPELAADLVHRQVAVIVTSGGDNPALAAKAATTTIPIVFNVGSDPVKVGLVASLARPGGNATGVNIFTSELAEKRFGLLHDVIPAAASFTVLVNPNDPPSMANAREVEAAGRRVGERRCRLSCWQRRGDRRRFRAHGTVAAGGAAPHRRSVLQQPARSDCALWRRATPSRQSMNGVNSPKPAA